MEYGSSSSYTRAIRDNRGRSFKAKINWDEEQLVVWLYDGKLSIGHLFGGIDEQVFELDDVKIDSDADFDNYYSYLKRRWLRHVRKQLWRYRDKGLGTALMHLVISEVRARGIRRIDARVTCEGPECGERLMRWYRGLGFELHDPVERKFPRHIADAVMGL